MDRLAFTCEEIQRHSSRTKRLIIMEDYFKTLHEDERALASQFLRFGPEARTLPNQTLFEVEQKSRLRISGSVLREALRAATGWDKETLRVCHTQVGDTAETISLLMRGISTEERMSLSDADRLYQELFQAGATARRVALLVNIFRKYRPLTLKYFVRVFTRSAHMSVIENCFSLPKPNPPTHSQGTLHVVITAAEQGVGRRDAFFSGYTLGVRSEEGFVNIGKSDAGLTAAEISALTKRLRAVATEKFGRALLVKPEIVVEVAFDRIERNTRRKAGYALLAPRIVRWHQDMRMEDCASIEQVEAIYLASRK